MGLKIFLIALSTHPRKWLPIQGCYQMTKSSVNIPGSQRRVSGKKVNFFCLPSLNFPSPCLRADLAGRKDGQARAGGCADCRREEVRIMARVERTVRGRDRQTAEWVSERR